MLVVIGTAVSWPSPSIRGSVALKKRRRIGAFVPATPCGPWGPTGPCGPAGPPRPVAPGAPPAPLAPAAPGAPAAALAAASAFFEVFSAFLAWVSADLAIFSALATEANAFGPPNAGRANVMADTSATARPTSSAGRRPRRRRVGTADKGEDLRAVFAGRARASNPAFSHQREARGFPPRRPAGHSSRFRR